LDWALDRIPWDGVERVVDAGCGNGAYFGLLRRRIGTEGTILGCDLSQGMIVSARHDGAVLAVGDVQELPLPGSWADVVLSMHMLYHAPDVSRAVREVRRVLRPGGTLLAATNAGDHQGELDEAFRRVARIEGADPLRVSIGRFSLENGESILRSGFDDIYRVDLPTTLEVPDVDALVAYIDSTRSWREGLLPADLSWDECLARFGAFAEAEIARQGTFRITAHAGVFVCR
ncbi:MAG: class I SAM-dependent methyltransferase, partial [Candidatus Binatia bacterium]